MRSEKEIMKKELTDFLEAGDRTTELTPVSKAFGWVLEGEPRYSVAELEKIIESDPMPDILEAKGLISILKNKEKVQEVLK